LPWCRAGGDALHHRHAFTAGTVGGLGEHRLARREMGVEAAVRQTGVFHDVGDAGAVEAAAPDGARGGVNDAIVRRFLGPSGEAFHMTIIILHFDTQRKRLFLQQLPFQKTAESQVRDAAGTIRPRKRWGCA